MTKPSKAKFALSANLQPYIERLREEVQQLVMAERDAAFRGLRVGIMLEFFKQQVPHGFFMAWAKATIPELGVRQRNYCMAVARRYVEQQKLAEPQVKALSAPKLEQKHEQLLLDFIGGRSQAELMDDLGVKLSGPKRTGGDNMFQKWLRENYPAHAGKNLREIPKDVKAAWEQYLKDYRPPKDPEAPRLVAEHEWKRLVGGLWEETFDRKSHIHLRHAFLEKYYYLLKDIRDELAKGLK